MPASMPGPANTQSMLQRVPSSHCVRRTPSSGASANTSSVAKASGATPRTRRMPIAAPSTSGSQSVAAASWKKIRKLSAWSSDGDLPSSSRCSIDTTTVAAASPHRVSRPSQSARRSEVAVSSGVDRQRDAAGDGGAQEQVRRRERQVAERVVLDREQKRRDEHRRERRRRRCAGAGALPTPAPRRPRTRRAPARPARAAAAAAAPRRCDAACRRAPRADSARERSRVTRIVITMTFTKVNNSSPPPMRSLRLPLATIARKPGGPMTSMSERWRESWRVLAYSVALALAFVGLQRLELALFSAFGTPAVLDLIGAGPARDDASLAVEAKQVAARSSAAAASLPAGHRLAAFRLGYEIGYASELVGSFAMSDAAGARPGRDDRRRARRRRAGAGGRARHRRATSPRCRRATSRSSSPSPSASRTTRTGSPRASSSA